MLLEFLLRLLPHLPLHLRQRHRQPRTLPLTQVYNLNDYDKYTGILIGVLPLGAMVGAGTAPLFMRVLTRKYLPPNADNSSSQ